MNNIFIELMRSSNPDFSLVCDSSSKLLAAPRPIKAGRDSYDHTILYRFKNDRTGKDAARVLEGVNVDSSVSCGQKELIQSGVYRLVAAIHRFGTPNAADGFFIMRLPHSGPILKFPTLLDAYNSDFRRGLPSFYNGTTDYINMHKGGIHSDASEGCFTVPDPQWTRFRSKFHYLEEGIMLFINRKQHPDFVVAPEIYGSFGLERN